LLLMWCEVDQLRVEDCVFVIEVRGWKLGYDCLIWLDLISTRYEGCSYIESALTKATISRSSGNRARLPFRRRRSRLHMVRDQHHYRQTMTHPSSRLAVTDLQGPPLPYACSGENVFGVHNRPISLTRYRGPCFEAFRTLGSRL
jgi:hypothetical protein